MSSVIVGIGSDGSQAAASLIREILARSKNHELVAVGVFNDEPGRDDVRGRFHRRAVRARVTDISIPPNQPDGVLAILNNVYQFAPTFTLLIIDADLLLTHRDAIINLRQGSPYMRAMCAITIADGAAAQATTLAALKELTEQEDPLLNEPILTYAILARKHSSLSETGHQHDLLAKSLAAVWSAPRLGHYELTFESFTQHLGSMRQEGHGILGLAVGSIGMPQTTNPFAHLYYWALPSRISVEQAQARIVELTKDLLHNRPQPMTTLERMPELDSSDPSEPKKTPDRELDLTLNITVPFGPGWFGSARDRYSDLIGQVRNGLRPSDPPDAASDAPNAPPNAGPAPTMSQSAPPPAREQNRTPGARDDMRGYAFRLVSLAKGKGVNLSKSKKVADFKPWKGAKYGQVCVFYPVDEQSEPNKQKDQTSAEKG